MTSPDATLPGRSRKPDRRRLLWAAAGVVLLALGLRAAAAAARDSVWRDEGQDIFLLDEAPDVGALWHTLAGEGTPPLHYLAEFGWIKVFGPGIGARRALSVLFGTLAVVLILLLGWKAFGPTCGVVSGLLAATSPFFIYYSGEIRNYALTAAVSALFALAYLRYLALPTWRRALLWGASAALLAYAHYFAFHLILVSGIYALWWERSRRGLWHAVLAGATFLVLFAPWLPTLLDQLGQELAPWFPGDPKLGHALLVLRLPFGRWGAWLAAGALLLGWRRSPRPAFPALIWLSLGAGALAWLVQLHKGPFNPRYLTPMAVALLIAASAFWGRLLTAPGATRRRLGLAGLGLLVALQWADARTWLKPSSPMPEVARRIEANARPDDLIWVYPAPYASSFFFSYRGPLRAIVPPYPGRVTTIDWRRIERDENDLARAHRLLADLEAQLARGGRVWLVASGDLPLSARWAFDDGNSPAALGRARMLHDSYQFHRRALRVLYRHGAYDTWRSWPDSAYRESVALVLFRPRRPGEKLVFPPARRSKKERR